MKVTIKCYRILHTKAKPVILFMATFSSHKNDNSIIIYPLVFLNLYVLLLQNTKRRYLEKCQCCTKKFSGVQNEHGIQVWNIRQNCCFFV